MITKFLMYLNNLFISYSVEQRKIIIGLILFVCICTIIKIINIVLSVHNYWLANIFIDIVSFINGAIIASVYFISTIVLWIISLFSGIHLNSNEFEYEHPELESEERDVVVLIDQKDINTKFEVLNINDENSVKRIEECSYVVLLSRNNDTIENSDIKKKLMELNHTTLLIPTDDLLQNAVQKE